MQIIDKLLCDFSNPPVEYRPVVFWSWNEAMDPDEIRRQVRLLSQGGMGGGFIHARVGLITRYMDQEWFTAVDAALDEAQKCGLKMYLYDEDKWPSGFAAGKVPLADEKYRMKALIARPQSAPMPSDAKPFGNPADGLQVYIYTSPLGHDWFNGTCYSDLMNSEAMDCFVKESYQPYFERYGRFYGNLICAEFTDEPCTIFRGRLPAGAVPYSDDLPKRFLEMHGYDPVNLLHLLFISAPEAWKFRLDYFRTVNDLFERNFSAKLGDWCSSHGIELTGHFMCEHGLYAQQLWGTKVMANYRHQGIPGIDHLGRQIDERISAKQCHSVVNQFGKKRMISELYGCSGQAVSFEDRFWIAAQQICLGVNMLNPHLSLYTMAGCRKRDFPPNIFYQQPWWPVNKAIDEPLSRMCVAMSQGKYHAEALIIHPQESTFVLWQSKSDCSNEVVGANLEWDWQPTVAEAADSINELDAHVKSIMNALLGAHRTFDFGDETIIANDGKVTVKNKMPYISIGKMDYPVVILPGMFTIARTTFDLLRKFKDLGGHIICCGQRPQLLDGSKSAELEKWLSGIVHVQVQRLSVELKKLINPAVEVIFADNSKDIGMLWIHVRNLPHDQRIVCLTNLDRFNDAFLKIQFNGKFTKLQLLNIWTGLPEDFDVNVGSGYIECETHIASAEAKIFLLSKERPVRRHVSNTQYSVRTFDLSNQILPFMCLDDNAFILDCACWRQANDKWSSKAVPVNVLQRLLNEAHYTGPLLLRYSFNADMAGLAGRQIRLVMEHPEYYCITVNKAVVNYGNLPFWKDPRWLPIDISTLLVSGENIIELYCDQFEFGDLADIDEPSRRYGTEIEALYIVGDFSVKGSFESNNIIGQQWNQLGLTPVKIRKLLKSSTVLTAPSTSIKDDVTLHGLPFYAGRLSAKIILPNIDVGVIKRAFIKIDRLDCPCAEVLVDGRSIGYLVGRMSSADITDAIHSGVEEIDLVLYGSLRNLLGPHHHFDGELASVSPESFFPHFDGKKSYVDNLKNWIDGKIHPVDWEDDYYVISFGELYGLRLEVHLQF